MDNLDPKLIALLERYVVAVEQIAAFLNADRTKASVGDALDGIVAGGHALNAIGSVITDETVHVRLSIEIGDDTWTVTRAKPSS